MARVQVRRSKVDGMHRRWEYMWASYVEGLGVLPRETALPGEDVRDYKLWVCTGVFASHQEAYR